MGLSEVKQEILTEARRRAEALVHDAEKQAKEHVAKALQDYDQEFSQEKKAFEQSLEQTEKRELAAASLEAKKYLFETKKQLLQEVYDTARAKIISLPASERKVILQRLLDKAKREVSLATVYSNNQDKHLISESAQLMPISGGIIAENKDGTVRVDYSFDTLFELVKEQTTAEVAHQLFR